MRKPTPWKTKVHFGRSSDAWDIGPPGFGAGSLHWQPLVDVAVSAEYAAISVELAGVSEKEIDVTVAGPVVRVAGHRPIPDPAARAPGVGYVRAEILYGAFERRVVLPWEGDPARLEVVYRDGLLFVRVQRRSVHHE